MDGYNYTSFIFHGVTAISDYIKALEDGLGRLLEAKSAHEVKFFKP